ncbi:MAG: hypothetical protein ACI934_001728 [Pseudohongiellaceae bacterium]|jgi:hypothetical protein
MKSLLKITGSVAVATLILMAWQVSFAHHSTVGQIEEFSIEISGVVKEFQFKNPHSWIQVMVEEENGEQVEWSVEWLIPNILMRQGYNPSTFKAGDEVRVRMRQHVSGSPMGEFDGAVKADGSIVGRWD